MRKIAQFRKYIRSLAIPPWTSFTVLYLYFHYLDLAALLLEVKIGISLSATSQGR
jgi:hypothetical protein